MCLHTINPVVRVADCDIVCYKVVTSSNKKQPKPGRYKSIWYDFVYELNHTYTEKEFCLGRDELIYDVFMREWLVNIGFHSFTYPNGNGPIDRGEFQVKCIIPKGAVYYESKDGAERCSNKIRIIAEWSETTNAWIVPYIPPTEKKKK